MWRMIAYAIGIIFQIVILILMVKDTRKYRKRRTEMSKKVKLLIELDEDDYKDICTVKGQYFLQTMWWAIRNGTPYNPSEDLISREALKNCAIPCQIHNGALTDLCVPLYQIDNAPAVPLPSEQTAWEQGYEAGLAQGTKGEWIMFKDVQSVIKPILKRFYGASDSDIEYIIQEIEQKAYLEGGTE